MPLTNGFQSRQYEPVGIRIGDFEYHDQRSIRKENPEIDLYVAVKAKSK